MKAAASILSVLACIVPSVQAETIYKYTNSQGDTVFTDQPTQGAQKIIMAELSKEVGGSAAAA
ncbi:MAG: hypothetical protein B7Z82_00565, partial [Halothiobacillus sp. 20-54-6]